MDSLPAVFNPMFVGMQHLPCFFIASLPLLIRITSLIFYHPTRVLQSWSSSVIFFHRLFLQRSVIASHSVLKYDLLIRFAFSVFNLPCIDFLTDTLTKTPSLLELVLSVQLIFSILL